GRAEGLQPSRCPIKKAHRGSMTIPRWAHWLDLRTTPSQLRSPQIDADLLAHRAANLFQIALDRRAKKWARAGICPAKFDAGRSGVVASDMCPVLAHRPGHDPSLERTSLVVG